MEAPFLHIPLPLHDPTSADTVPSKNQTESSSVVPGSGLEKDRDRQSSSDDSYHPDDEVRAEESHRNLAEMNQHTAGKTLDM